MKIMTINFKNDGIKPFSNWKKRLLSVVELLKNEQPDIIGCQELTYKAKKKLTKLLEDNNLKYNIYGESRKRNNTIYDEYNSILVKENIKVISTKTYSLSPTPELPKTRFKKDHFPRIITYIETDNYNIYNTHLSNKPQENKLLQLECISKIIKKDKPIIITGDFNTGYKNLINLCETHNLKDATKDIGKTFSTKKDIYHLDHILINKNINVIKTTKHIEKILGLFPSDHYPVSITIE